VAATLRSQAREDFGRFGSAEFVPVVFANWRDDPFDGLTRAVAAAASEFAVVAKPLSTSGSLVEVIEAAAGAAQASVLVILDQFEEYFLYHRAEEGPSSFAAQLAEAVNRPGLPAGFLVAMRDDSLAQLDAFRGRIPRLFSSYRRINPLTKAAARQAVVKPLEEYNRLVGPGQAVAAEDGLVSAVVEQVASGQVKLDSVGAGALDGVGVDAVEAPYLQLVMSRLWQEEALAGSRLLRLSTLEALGGAQKIVRGHLDATLGALPPLDQEVAADVFHHLVTPSGTKIAHAVADLVDYTGWPEERISSVLERLGEGGTRIVRPVQPPAGHEGPPRYEIFHDVLAPAVLDWRGRHEKEAAQQQKREAEHQAWVQRRRAMVAWVAAGLSVLLLAAVAVFAGYVVSQANADRSRALAGYAEATLTRDPELSALLALSALRKSPTPEAEAALRQAYPLVQEERLLPWGGEISDVALSPSGREVAASATHSGVVRIWGSNGASHVDLSTVFSSVNGTAFSPDGRTIAVVGQVPSAKPWRFGHWPGAELIELAKEGRPRVLLVPRSADVGQWGQSVAWVSTSSLVVADDHGWLCLYSLSDGGAGRCRKSGFSALGTLSTNRAGTMLAVSGQAFGSETAALYSVPSLSLLEPAGQEVWGLGSVTDAVLSPNGSELATTSAQGTTLVYDVRSATVLAKVTSSGEVESASFSADGSDFATTTDLGTTTVWQVDPSSELGAVEVARLTCDCGVVYTSAFGPPGSARLVTGSEDGVVRVWGTQPSGLVATYQVSASFPFVGYPDGVTGVSFVPGLDDVVALISGPSVTGVSSQPDRVVVLDMRTGRWAAIGGKNSALDLASVGVSGLLAGRRALVVGVYEGGSAPALRAWELTNASGAPHLSATALKVPHRWPVTGGAGEVADVVVSPDGKWLAVAFSNSVAIDVLDLEDGSAAALPRTASYFYFVDGIAFDALSRYVVTAYNSGAAWEWRLPLGSGKARFVRAFHDPQKNAVLTDAKFSSDGRMLALADNFGNVTVFSTGTGRQLLGQLNAGTGQLNSVGFGDNATTVLTSGDDGTVRVWDLSTGQLLLTLGPTDEPTPSAVNSAVFATLKGREVIVAGGNDGMVRVWDAQAATPDIHEIERLAMERLAGRCYTAAELSQYGSPAQVFPGCVRN